MIEETTASSETVAAVKRAKQQAAEVGLPSMYVKVYSPFTIYYDQESYSISAVNATGPFDILPTHHNFMTLLDACVLTLRPVEGQNKEQKIRISGGLMHVKADKVTVFLDI